LNGTCGRAAFLHGWIERHEPEQATMATFGVHRFSDPFAQKTQGFEQPELLDALKQAKADSRATSLSVEIAY
jgi:hypothetical protein